MKILLSTSKSRVWHSQKGARLKTADKLAPERAEQRTVASAEGARNCRLNPQSSSQSRRKLNSFKSIPKVSIG